MMQNVLHEGTTRFCRDAIEHARVLVDACDYYRAFCRAARHAERTLLISGWQFHTRVRLLRGDEASRAEHPVELIAFLNWLCERKPTLHVYILAWDHSSVYAVEREWLQSLKLTWRSHARVHFNYWTHPEPGGSFHQKYVVVDDWLAFLGGIDLCEDRWDDRRHRPDDPRRVDTGGNPGKPFHDIQAAFTGKLTHALQASFAKSWHQACGERLKFENGSRADQVDSVELTELCSGCGLALRAADAALSRTEFRDNGRSIREVQDLLHAAILASQRLIYIESQYFTSRAVLAAFRRRLGDRHRSTLTIVIMMPHGADSPKEDFVLGDRQRAVRYALAELAKRYGHELRLLYSRNDSKPTKPVNTFIHSKLLIVDDEFVTIGSANLTNRSMQLDSEMNLSFQDRPQSLLCADIRSLRASLLAEHAGLDEAEDFAPIDTLVARIDSACHSRESKLRHHEIAAPSDEDPILMALFDPAGAVTWSSLEESLGQAFKTDDGWLKKSLRRAGQRLGVIDID